MAGEAQASGHIVEISTDYLKDFASHELEPFLVEVEDDTSVKALSMFADGVSAGGSGSGPAGHYSALLGANDKCALDSAHQLKSQFTKLAQDIGSQVESLLSMVETFQKNLNTIDMYMSDADTEAKITAETMKSDLSGVGSSGGSSTDSVSPPS